MYAIFLHRSCHGNALVLLLQVRVSIISEAQANGLLKHDVMGKNEQSGEILNSTGTMEYIQVSA